LWWWLVEGAIRADWNQLRVLRDHLHDDLVALAGLLPSLDHLVDLPQRYAKFFGYLSLR
jgi:hypothetical protein